MNQQSLDSKWFDTLRNVYDGVPSRLVAGRYNSARKQFFDSGDPAPRFVYDTISDPKFEEKKETLLVLQEDIALCDETHPVVKKLYLEKIQEKLALLNLVKIASVIVSQDRLDVQQANRFVALTNRVFGPVQPHIFAHACAIALRQLTDMPVVTGKPALLSSVASVLESGSALSSFEIKNLSLPASLAEDSVITEQQLVIERFRSVLHEHGLYHWKVEPGNRYQTTFVVKPKRHRIIVPNKTALCARAGKALLTERKLRALIEHEMVHVLRYERGITSRLKLLAVGLPGYYAGEEGYATYCEQQIHGAADYAGGKYYIAAGLAVGLDRGGEPRNFREMYNFMHDWYCLEEKDGQRDPQKLAFHFCSVLFKGVRGHNPGVILTLQTGYREGNIAVHKTMEECPVWKKFGHIGKYDFTNSAHITALQELEILPRL